MPALSVVEGPAPAGEVFAADAGASPVALRAPSEAPASARAPASRTVALSCRSYVMAALLPTNLYRESGARFIGTGGCAMSINGPITSTNESLFLGSLLDARWPKPSKDANGLLLDCSLLEAQPHLGKGVRFPRASYMTLLYNIIQSGIKDWRVVRPRPFNACIPSWRLFSLYPISVSKLIADLRVRRWCGSISMQAFPVETSQWWLGLPKEPELKRVHNASSYIPELDRHLEESSTSLCAKAGRWAVTETLMTGAVRSTYTLPSGCWPLKVVPQQEALHVQRTLAVLNKVLVKKGGR